jgi:hypothetical protein
MQFSSILFAMSLLAPLCAGHPSPDADANAIADPGSADAFGLLEARDGVLEKRACMYNGCQCRSGMKQGQYCYGCNVVPNVGDTNAWNTPYNGWVFECSPSGKCCTYGPRTSCKGGKKSPCGPK